MKLACTLLLLFCYAAAQVKHIPTAALPVGVPSSTLTAGEQALLSSATANGQCVASAHVWCVGHAGDGTNGGQNGQRFLIGQTNGAAMAGAYNNIVTGNSPDGEVVVLDSKTDAPGGYVGNGPGNIGFQTGGTSPDCSGNNTPQVSVEACLFVPPPLIQFDYAHPKKLFVITSHWSSFPPIGTLAIPNIPEVDQTGHAAPAGYIANVQPNDYALIQDGAGTAASNASLNLRIGDDNMVFWGIEFTVQNNINANGTNGDGSRTQLGLVYPMVKVQGTGQTGNRSVAINPNPANTTQLVIGGQAATIVGDQPYVVSCTYDSPTGPPCGSVLLDPGATPTVPNSSPIRRLYFVMTPPTKMAQGYTAIQFTWQNWDRVATIDGTNDAIAIQPTPCGAGNTTPPNICVTDQSFNPITSGTSQYGYVDIKPFQPYTAATCQASNLCFNGGIYSFFIEAYPTGACPNAYPLEYYQPGGSWSACTQHISYNDTVAVAYDSSLQPPFTITCPTCPTDHAGRPALPHTRSRYDVTITGTPGKTGWKSNNRFNIRYGGAPDQVAGTPTVDVPTQVITGQWMQTTPTGGIPDIRQSPTVFVSPGVLVYATPPGEFGELFRGIVFLNRGTFGIDYCGRSPQASNNVVRGQQYTESCYGINTNWATIPPCASDPCPLNYVNMGDDIDIMAYHPVSATQIDITFFVCDGVTVHAGCRTGIAADQGAKNVWFVQDWFHGQVGQLIKVSDGVTPCTPALGDFVDTCFMKNSRGVVQALVFNGTNGIIRDSYCNDIIGPANNINQDSQCISFTIGTGPALIENNALLGGAENLLAGGAGNGISGAPISPRNVYVHHNYMMHPPIFRARGIAMYRHRSATITSVCIGVTCNGGTGETGYAYVEGTNSLFAGGNQVTLSGFTDPGLTFLNSKSYTVLSRTNSSFIFNSNHADQALITNNGIGRQESANCALTPGGVVPPDNNYACVTSIKNNFEIKSGQNWLVEGNVLDGQWTAPVAPYPSFVFTPRVGSGQGHSNSSVNDVVLRDNYAINTLHTFAATGDDSACNSNIEPWGGDVGCNQGSYPATTNRRMIYRNNLGNLNQSDSSPPYPFPQNPAKIMKIGPFQHDMLFEHNTIALATPLFPSRQGFFYDQNAAACNVTRYRGAWDVWILNNVMYLNFGSNGGCTITQWLNAGPPPNATTDMISGNILTFTGGTTNNGANTTTNANAFTNLGVNGTPTFQSPNSNTYIPSTSFTSDYTLVGGSSLTPWITGVNTTDGKRVGYDDAELRAAVGNTWTGLPGAAAPTHLISGTITLSGAALSGVAVQLSGLYSGQTVTDALGHYSFSQVAGNYTVTPTLSGHSFTPSSIPVTVAGANSTGNDFTAAAVVINYTISGTVTKSGAGLAGVTLTVDGRSTTTDASGNYSIGDFGVGSYTITPALAGHTFDPSDHTVTIAGANISGRDFTATAEQPSSHQPASMHISRIGPGTSRRAPAQQQKPKPNQ